MHPRFTSSLGDLCYVYTYIWDQFKSMTPHNSQLPDIKNRMKNFQVFPNPPSPSSSSPPPPSLFFFGLLEWFKFKFWPWEPTNTFNHNTLDLENQTHSSSTQLHLYIMVLKISWWKNWKRDWLPVFWLNWSSTDGQTVGVINNLINNYKNK